MEIAGETLGSSKMSISPETSPKKRDVETAAVRLLSGALLEDPQDGPRGEIIEKTMVLQHFCSEVSVSLETSSKNAFGRVLKNVML